MSKPVKHFQRYSSAERADRLASHRLGYRQKQQFGEVFWTHPHVPGLAFATKAAAVKAAKNRAADIAISVAA